MVLEGESVMVGDMRLSRKLSDHIFNRKQEAERMCQKRDEALASESLPVVTVLPQQGFTFYRFHVSPLQPPDSTSTGDQVIKYLSL